MYCVVSCTVDGFGTFTNDHLLCAERRVIKGAAP